MTPTGSDGSAAVRSLGDGKYLLSVVAPGYEGTDQQVTLSRGQVATLEIRLESSAAVVAGRVTDTASEAALAGATVSLGNWTALTDEDGRYRLEGVLPGTHLLQVSADGYDTYQETVAVEPRGELARDVSLAPTPGFLRVRVVDAATGLPIEGATVTYRTVVEAPTPAEQSLPCADYKLLVPLKRSEQYRAVRPQVSDPRPSDNWQENGLHFFVFTLWGGEDGTAGVVEGGVANPIEPPVAVFVMRPGVQEPVSAVVVRSRPDGQEAEVTPIAGVEPASSQAT